mgnify:CR=1 FL=1
MPKGPKGEKRPTDAIGLAVMIGKIATGQVDDETPDDGKDPAAKAMGSKARTAVGDRKEGSGKKMGKD